MDDKTITKKVELIESSCPTCGSDLSFDPETQKLICRNCKYEKEIQKNTNTIEEYDFQSVLAKYKTHQGNIKIQQEIKCSDCGATILVNDKTISTICPFCNSSRTIKQSTTDSIIQIEGVVPFKIAKSDVDDIFHKWIKKRFWAPSKFKKGKAKPTYTAFYIPFWTYDSCTNSNYTAMRGDYYYVTVRTRVNGKTVTRQERRIRWTPVSGRSNCDFDDIVVRGTSNALNNHIDKIKNYDLKKELIKYDEQYLLGYYAEKPSIDIENGFAEARKIMANYIQNQIKREIGGDTVSNLRVNTSYSNITFKQIMAPIYNGTYKFKNKIFHFIMNGNNSQISADYPKSVLKILLVIFLSILLFVGFFFLIFNYS